MWWPVDTLWGQLRTLSLEVLQATLDALPFFLLFGAVFAWILWLMWGTRPALRWQQWVVSAIVLAVFFLLLQLGASLVESVALTINGQVIGESIRPFVLFAIWLLCVLGVLIVGSVSYMAVPAKVLLHGTPLSQAITESKHLASLHRRTFFRHLLVYEFVVYLGVGIVLDYLIVVPGVIQFICLYLLAAWMTGRYIVWYEDLTKHWNRE
jgi:hypothetical protein